jgi:putative phosphoribosyl transferase
MIFPNRTVAGRWLAAELEQYRPADPVVLALPRGGVPVAYEVAHALEAQLDVLVVRKLGAPGQPEFAIGAVAPGVVVLDEETLFLLSVPREYVARVVERERREVSRRAAAFRDPAWAVEVGGRTALIVDDGMATGSTMLAAADCVRKRGAARVAVAVPVASPDAVRRVRARADDVVCLESPAEFFAVGAWYEDFTQTSDEEVRLLLKRAWLEYEARFHGSASTP